MKVNRARTAFACLATATCLASPALADPVVFSGSPAAPFPQNKQNEPAVAVDPLNPELLISGSNDEIDEPACAGSDCSFVAGVGNSGVSFSADGGSTWTQPTYRGLTGRTSGGTPTSPRTTYVGPIGTVPSYYEAGLVSDGDPSVAFGPKYVAGGFTYAQGPQAYYASLTANLGTTKSDETFKGFEAMAVSHTTNLSKAIAGSATSDNGWSAPSVISSTKQSAVTFSDKEALTVDGASGSPYFGYAYVCWTDFRSNSSGGQPIVVSRSRDGGDTWTSPMALTPAASSKGGRQGCDIKTDGSGVVYAFLESQVQGNKGNGILMARSFDGGRSFDKPRPVADVVDIGQASFTSAGYTDIDGVAGARADSFPHVAIAGSTIVLAWADGRLGLGQEQELAQVSRDRGVTWTPPVNIALPGDRPVMPGVALSPDASTLYSVYSADRDPFRDSLTGSRRFLGVLLRVPVTATGLGTSVQETAESADGDGRASSANALGDEFIGDYNQVAATPAGAVGVYTSLHDAAQCDAVNAYRQGLVNAAQGSATPAPPKPAPIEACTNAAFGNTQIKALVTP